MDDAEKSTTAAVANDQPEHVRRFVSELGTISAEHRADRRDPQEAVDAFVSLLRAGSEQSGTTLRTSAAAKVPRARKVRAPKSRAA